MIIDSSAIVSVLLEEPDATLMAAAILGEPLLFKGDDFRRTDITPALAA